MKNSQFVDDRRKSAKLIAFQCDCGIPFSGVAPAPGSHCFLDCPNCRKVWQIVYEGKRPAPKPEPEPAPLRLAHA
jgi:hypothetical protein